MGKLTAPKMSLQAHNLSHPQIEAIRHIREWAIGQRVSAHEKLAGILERTNSSPTLLNAVMELLQAQGQVILNFHPDRLNATGTSVAAALLQEGCYRNQFETGLSNGSRTAFPGGSRDTWEAWLFGGAYHSPGVTGVERPKYGALELIRHADGAAPRFGSCYFVLNTAVSRRSTFTYGDSHLEPEQVGTLDTLDNVMAALLAEIETTGSALGLDQLTVPTFLTLLSRELAQPRGTPATGRVGRALDAYIEAQVHGMINLHTDVELLVADPAFRATPTGELLEAISTRYAIKLDWHPGFSLPVTAVPADFRGPAMPPLARRMTGEGRLTVALIGHAAASLHRHPEEWADWGTDDETLQHLKQLWHVLVYYGEPANATH